MFIDCPLQPVIASVSHFYAWDFSQRYMLTRFDYLLYQLLMMNAGTRYVLMLRNSNHFLNSYHIFIRWYYARWEEEEEEEEEEEKGSIETHQL